MRIAFVMVASLIAGAGEAGAGPEREIPPAPDLEVDLPNPLAEVRFASNSARIDPGANRELRAVVRWMHDHPDRLVVVEGHADRTGGWSANLALSQRRADRVRDQLVRLGADPLRIVEAAYGEIDATAGAASRVVVLRGTERGFAELIGAQHQEAPTSSPTGERPRLP